MRAPIFICSLLALAILENHALRQRGGGSQPAKVAGVVAAHPISYKYFVRFLREWEQCPQGREAMDLMPVFSNEEDYNELKRQLNILDTNFDYHSFTPLFAQSLPSGAKPAAWKKLDGLAQVLSRMDGYEFALLLDAEIHLHSCAGFEKLLANLRNKQSAGIWYGDTTPTMWNTTKFKYFVRDAACAVAPPVKVNRNSTPSRLVKPKCSDTSCPDWFTTTPCTGHPSIMPHIAKVTNDFKVFTWWNDLPYVHIDTAQRMFQSWTEELKSTDLSFGRQRPSNCEQCRALAYMIPRMQLPGSSDQRNIPATSVTENMGKGHGETMEIAGKGFEHLIYQFYTVAEGSFQIKDLTGALRHHEGFAALERFWILPEEDRTTIIETIHPLWLPCRSSDKYDYHMGRDSPSVLLNFHMDREYFGKCRY
jgi:hypothetical protein